MTPKKVIGWLAIACFLVVSALPISHWLQCDAAEVEGSSPQWHWLPVEAEASGHIEVELRVLELRRGEYARWNEFAIAALPVLHQANANPPAPSQVSQAASGPSQALRVFGEILEATKHRTSGDNRYRAVAGAVVGTVCMVDPFLGGDTPVSLRPAGAVVVDYSGQSATRASASFAGSLHGFALVAVGAGYSTLSHW